MFHHLVSLVIDFEQEYAEKVFKSVGLYYWDMEAKLICFTALTLAPAFLLFAFLVSKIIFSIINWRLA